MLPEAKYYARMAFGYGSFLRAPLPSDPRAVLERQLDHRERIFLETARRTIFADPGNPYHQMFRLAGCGYEDLAGAVRRDGLEAALAALRRAGVYLTHDEFKAAQPIVRSGRHIPSTKTSFANPLVGGFFEYRSSGSRSRGTRVRHATEFLAYRAVRAGLIAEEFGLAERAEVALYPTLPAGYGLILNALAARLGRPWAAWFAAGGSGRANSAYRLLTAAMTLEARLLGVKATFPVYLPPQDFSPVARFLARLRAEGVPAALSAQLSPAVRVAAAARDLRLDIRGTLFLTVGEAITEAKRAVVESTGAEIFPWYGIGEVGPVGHACRQMRSGNCVHLYRDAFAAINWRRPAPLAEAEVDSLLLTTLLPFSPLVLINAEFDDAGIVEPATCECRLRAAGYTERIRDLGSFGKLTGHGMTLVGTKLVELLERALPARLGGAPGDFQLVEEEGEAHTQITLRVSPRIGVRAPEKVETCFYEELRKLHGGSLSSRTWRHAGAVRVVIAEPFATASGKVLALHLMRYSRAPRG